MKVVVDTNVVVSAALKDRNPEAVILFVVNHPEFEWVASPEVIAEYAEVLRRTRFHLPETIIHKWKNLFASMITVVETQGGVDFPRGQKDAKFLACALTAEADYFITGDKDFENAYKVGSTTVISVSMFKRLVCDTWESSTPNENA
ncbi:MAG: putative toxin-antitoxin system toxin component, PIN family [Chloroflexi bacterium]|nr:putative toxin-antitoxin system toxin component, PIN family [Chloroflexota bacterium]